MSATAERRVVITGMALNTPLGDTVDGVLHALLAGRSGVGAWRAFAPPPLGALVGGDLSAYDIPAKIAALRAKIPGAVYARLDKMNRRIPWSTRLSLLVAADAAQDAGWWAPGSTHLPEDVGVVVAGHNLSPRYALENWQKEQVEPDYVDALLAVHMLDTNHAACVSELLGTQGPISTVGMACASGNLALRAALDELAEGATAVFVVGPVYDYAVTTFQALGFMRATTETGASEAARASRPFNRDRDGFVPSHGAAALVLETLAHATARGAPVLAELLAAEAGSDACHRPPKPSPVDQAALIQAVLARARLAPEDVDLVCAHAASTQVGDLAEAQALTLALGAHAETVAVNAAKSMLGHTGWSAALVAAVLAVAQLRRGEIHGTANLDDPDPRVHLALSGAASRRPVRTILNHAFGFGGLNCISVLRSLP